jgi:type II secretion system protein G
MRKAFTLAEILIVVGIIGILAAIVLPEFKSHTQKAKEAAAKDNLRIFRTAIERYTIEHNDIPPGYQDGDPANLPAFPAFRLQLVFANHYLPELPENPFNGTFQAEMLADEEPFPEEAVSPDFYGWIYKPATKTIKLNWPGTDSTGVAYLDY